MKIKILGTRGEISESHRNYAKHSGILIDDVLMFDLGESDFLVHRPKYIFITHLHPDHAFFVRKNDDISEIANRLYLPEQYKGDDRIHLINSVQRCAGFKINPIPTKHSLKVKSQAYLIQKHGQRILYTGDLYAIDEQYYSKIKNLDAVITEASFIRRNGLIKQDETTKQYSGHTGIPNLIELFREFTKHIIFMHFGSWFYKDIRHAKNKIHQLGKQNGVHTYIAHDGISFNSGEFF